MLVDISDDTGEFIRRSVYTSATIKTNGDISLTTGNLDPSTHVTLYLLSISFGYEANPLT